MQIPQAHLSEVIEETLKQRVENTIAEYVEKNADAFAEHRIAGIEWNLGLTVLVDNLGLNPQPQSKSLFKRLIDFLTRLWRKAESAQEPEGPKAH